MDRPCPGMEENCCAATPEQIEIMRKATRVFIGTFLSNLLRGPEDQIEHVMSNMVSSYSR
jgi:hypothetical protein